MEAIREQLMYKTNTLHVCMKALTRQEQFEFIRLLMATRSENVHICNCQCNPYVLCVLNRLGIERTQCLRVE
jgi:hypothetical protein